MEGSRSGRSGWLLVPALFLTLLLLVAHNFVQAMAPPDRSPIPRPSQEIDELRIADRLLALKVYRIVTEAQAQQQEADRWRLVEEVEGYTPSKGRPGGLRAQASRRD